MTATALRGVVCMLAGWAELPIEKIAGRKGLRWNQIRCGLYLVTISLAPLRAAVTNKVWFCWYLFAPTSRALALLAAQVEISGWPSWPLLVMTAGTLIAVDPPFGGRILTVHHRVLTILYAWGFLTGAHGNGDHRELRWMLTGLAGLEVLYFSGGWEWGLWWLFPVAQTLVKLGGWAYARRSQES